LEIEMLGAAGRKEIVGFAGGKGDDENKIALPDPACL